LEVSTSKAGFQLLLKTCGAQCLFVMEATGTYKAFRSIRRGVQQVVKDIKAGSFGNDFKGTSLKFVLSVISEQK
jgi:hypothetical protein